MSGSNGKPASHHVCTAPGLPENVYLFVPLRRKVGEGGYSKGEAEALGAAYSVAAQIHQDETRKSTGRPYIDHCGKVGGHLMDQQKDFYAKDLVLTVSGLLHDTVERLEEKNPGLSRRESLDEVLGCFEAQLEQRRATYFLPQLPHISLIVDGLSKELPDTVYYKQIARIREIPDEVDRLRALNIKVVDRGFNSDDTEHYSVPEKLNSVFKTLYVLNETKKYLVRTPVQGGGSISYMSLTPLLFLSQILPHNVNLMCAKTNWVLDEIPVELRKEMSRSFGRRGPTEHERTAMQERFFSIAIQRDHYDRRGGFAGVTDRYAGDSVSNEGWLTFDENYTTPEEGHSIFDGRIKQFDGFIRDKNTFRDYHFTIPELYAITIGFKQILRHLAGEPDYFLQGLEWEQL